MKTSDYITNTAIKMIRKNGLINLSRVDLCRRVNIADGSWIHIMGCSFSDFLAKLRERDIESDIHHKVVKTRTDPQLRKENILKVAITLAEKNGIQDVQRNHIANCAGVSLGLVTKYFGTIKKLRRSVIRAAIKQENLRVIGHAIMSHDAAVAKISMELRMKAIESIQLYV